VRGKQGARGDAEILAAGAAAEAHGAGRTTALIGLEATAFGANRGAIRLRPADGTKGRLGFHVRRAEHLSEAQGLGLAGEEEVLGHGFVSDAMTSYVMLCRPLSMQIVSDMMFLRRSEPHGHRSIGS